MSFDAAAQAGNVFRFGEIHLEQEAGACAEGHQVFGSGRGQGVHCGQGRVHRLLVDFAGAGFGHQRRGVESQVARVGLAEFLAAAVAVQIAVGAHVDDEVVGVQSAAESCQDLIAARARAQGHIDHFGTLAIAPAAGQFVQLTEGPRRDRIQERRRDIGGGVGGV